MDDRAQPEQVVPQASTSGPACSFRVPQRAAQCLRADSSCTETSQRKWSGKYLWYGEAILQAQTKMRFTPQSRSQSSGARLSRELGLFSSKCYQFRSALDKTAPPSVIIIITLEAETNLADLAASCTNQEKAQEGAASCSGDEKSSCGTARWERIKRFGV